MRVSVELPDPPALEPLLQGLSQQYAEVVRQLMHLQEQATSSERYQPIVQALAQQQDTLMAAFQHMLSVLHSGKQQDAAQMQRVMREEVVAPQQQALDSLLSAFKGMKRSLSSLPDDLGGVMSKQMQARQQTLQPQAPVPKPVDTSRAVVQKLDSMEQALVAGLKKSRNRTFGSNY